MTQLDRRRFLLAATAALNLPTAIARAAAIDADVRTGTIRDVEHVVILMQENRSFDHYFGAMPGVRGFGDRFAIPVPDAPGLTAKTNWTQVNTHGLLGGGPPLISPFPLNTVDDFDLMRVEGTPHNWTDAQAAWNEGRINQWPTHKTAHAMGHYLEADIPFQYALANAFTICDAYHCAMHVGTNSNRLFLWTGTNDPSSQFGGPSLSNSHDSFVRDGGAAEGYRWTTYVERLQAAGIGWRVYQDMADNFTDNPLAGFQRFRDSHDGAPGSDPRLAERGLSTRALDGLKADVLAGALPPVSYIVAPAKDSEHPGPSSPAQGADYTARVLDALTADPKVWAKTVLLVMFDENDGFFDHVPPPAPPSRDPDRPGSYLGASTVDTTGEYHLHHAPSEAKVDLPQFVGRPYGLGPRVPMYIVSPWSRGGWVNAQVFDHTSVIRFLEARFGVMEPNISPWRRAVCGDLTSAFDFKAPNVEPFVATLPPTAAIARRAAALPGRTTPETPPTPLVPVQATGVRPSRALPYALNVEEAALGDRMGLRFVNQGQVAAVFHVYDRRNLESAPRRYTVEPGKTLADLWPAGPYDLWVLAPNGFHRHLVGEAPEREASVTMLHASGPILALDAYSQAAADALCIAPNAYGESLATLARAPSPPGHAAWSWTLAPSGGWYDVSITSPAQPRYLRRLAGRLETGAPSTSDPAMGGPARMDQAVWS
jgi:phospholipase C